MYVDRVKQLALVAKLMAKSTKSLPFKFFLGHIVMLFTLLGWQSSHVFEPVTNL